MTQQSIKAIETVYNGYRFRSRLEARWAVFFDALGVKYEYEKEGFDLGEAGWYLPDFWLPELKCWIEIKGQEPTEREEAVASRLAVQSGADTYLFWGPVEVPFILHGNGGMAWDGCGPAFWYSPSGEERGHTDAGYWWCECPVCHKLTIQFEGRVDRITCNCPEAAKRSVAYACATPRIMAAYTAARQARFEHGETPPPPQPARAVTIARPLPKVQRPKRARRAAKSNTPLWPDAPIWPDVPMIDPHPGDRVEHRLYGCGTILLAAWGNVEVLFDNGMQLVLALEFARLKLIEPSANSVQLKPKQTAGS